MLGNQPQPIIGKVNSAIQWMLKLDILVETLSSTLMQAISYMARNFDEITPT